MIHRIMLAAALLAVPAIVVAEQPARFATQAKQADTSKAKAPATPKKKKAKAAKKPAAKPAAAAAAPVAKDTAKAK